MDVQPSESKISIHSNQFLERFEDAMRSHSTHSFFFFQQAMIMILFHLHYQIWMIERKRNSTNGNQNISHFSVVEPAHHKLFISGMVHIQLISSKYVIRSSQKWII